MPSLDRLPGVPPRVVADRGDSGHGFRRHIAQTGAQPAVPSKRDEAPARCPDWIYTNRNGVERSWARLKEWRAVATRYEKTAVSLTGVLCLAAALDRIKRRQTQERPSPKRIRFGAKEHVKSRS